MKQRNNTLVWVISAIAVLGLCGGGGLIGLIFYSRASSVSSAGNAGDQILAQISKPWNGRAIASVSDPYDSEASNLEKAEKLAAALDKEFGSLINSKGSIGDLSDLGDAVGTFSEAQYLGTGNFEKSPGDIIMTLRRRDGKWYLIGIDVFGPNSPRGGHQSLR